MTNTLSYGSPEQALIDQAINTFTGASFSNLSFCTTPVELLPLNGDEAHLRHASGFFWRYAGVDFVVTNWHVISGRHPFTLELLDKEGGFIPRKLRVYGWQIGAREGQLSLNRPGWTADLGDIGMTAFETPPIIDGRPVDIAAIPMPPGFAMTRDIGTSNATSFSTIESCVNMRVQDRIETQAGDECVILGYPLANYSGLKLPIWKRGSLATDSNMAIDSSAAFLIDAATASAMSGSPIFRRVAGIVRVDPNTQIVSEHRGYEFVGVYAGRLQNKELERINLGYGWLGSQVEAAIAQSWERWRVVADARQIDLDAGGSS